MLTSLPINVDDSEDARVPFEAFVGTGPELRGLSSVALAWAKALLDAGERDEAQAVLDRVDPEALAFEDVVDAAIQERRLGRHRNAHRSFSRVAAQLAGDARALHELAQTKLAIAREPGVGASPPTAPAPESPTAADPLDAQARRALLLEARGLLERVLQLGAPVSRHAWASFHLGQVLEALGAPRSEAWLAYAEASRRLPDQPTFTEALARLRLTPDDDP